MKFDEMTWEEVEYITNKISIYGIDVSRGVKLSDLSVILIDGDGFIEMSSGEDLEDIHLGNITWYGGGNVGIAIGRPPYDDERTPTKYLISEIPEDMHDHLVGIINMEMM